eukprot:1275045-Prymnesium_polylepis.2
MWGARSLHRRAQQGRAHSGTGLQRAQRVGRPGRSSGGTGGESGGIRSVYGEFAAQCVQTVPIGEALVRGCGHGPSRLVKEGY